MRLAIILRTPIKNFCELVLMVIGSGLCFLLIRLMIIAMWAMVLAGIVGLFYGIFKIIFWFFRPKVLMSILAILLGLGYLSNNTAIFK